MSYFVYCIYLYIYRFSCILVFFLKIQIFLFFVELFATIHSIQLAPLLIVGTLLGEEEYRNLT